MKNLNKYLTVIILAVVVTSCKDEKQELANQKLERFKTYVDSVSEITTEKTAKNWESIQAKYEKNKMEAQEALDKLENKMNMDTILDKTNDKYEAYKAAVILKKEVLLQNSFRNSFFTQKIDEDLEFNWVNKDNIADVYANFVSTVEKNKAVYTRENWDEIKLIYEALDTRKNTIEKEGLSSKDNIRIAGLKIKFGTMYQINRATAKSDENEEAKE